MYFIKKIIKKIIGKKNIFRINYTKRISRNLHRQTKSKLTIIKDIPKVKIYTELSKLFNNINFENVNKAEEFYYNLDVYKTIYKENKPIENLTIDYEKILDNSLLNFKEQINKNKKEEEFYKDEIETVEAIEILINRTIEHLNSQNANEEIINNIKNIKENKAINFKEALQRILFFNQILWQTNHRLNGLGRLDKILYKYYEKDIRENNIDKNEVRQLIEQFMVTLHKYYNFKSNVLMGDTGQIIELGGKNINEEYECNELTYMFIDVLKELNIPDPKILLRVSKETPRDLIEKSLECIQTGIGCPLFANDDVIIPKLIEFGYRKEDSYGYGTSACWEPFIIGKSFDQNNIKGFVFIEPFEKLLENEKLNEIQNIEQLMDLYKKYLEVYVNKIIKESEETKWQKDTILTLVTDNCIEENKDISKGGAIYNNYGFTGVGLSNLVNSIINIDYFVFKNKEYTFEQLNEIRKNNFVENEEIVSKLKETTCKYGNDNKEVIELTNSIIKSASEFIGKYKNPLGGKYKFGLSAPSYITRGKESAASFDGRKNGEPFGVHISFDNSNAYTELVQFASQIDYGENRLNGNVVDFFVSPNFIKDNFDKFVDFLMLSIKVGFFEMQMNVVSSKTLIEARKNPEKFPNLIVRVWGFSAYFKDLPDEYKDNLIKRALESEGISQ